MKGLSQLLMATGNLEVPAFARTQLETSWGGGAPNFQSVYPKRLRKPGSLKMGQVGHLRGGVPPKESLPMFVNHLLVCFGEYYDL